MFNLKITKKMKTYTFNKSDKNAKYELYCENLLTGTRSISRYCKTIKDALLTIDSIITGKHQYWRLIRVCDGKNFTTKIY